MRERSRSREWALRILYAWETRGGAPLDVVLEDFMVRRTIAPARRDYIRRLIAALAERVEEVDDELRECIANWRLERLSAIDRNVLRIAAVEMLAFDDVPPRVSIQEALRLAEKYGTEQSPRFVNGVLDALMRRLAAA